MTEIVLTSSVLILLLAILRQVLRGRISPCLQYALWLLAAARLLIPGTLFTAPVSVLGATEGLQTTLHQTFPDPDNLPEPVINDILGQLPQPVPAQPTQAVHPDGDAAVTRQPASPAVTQRVYNWPDIIWKTGIAIVGVAMAASNLVFYLRLRKSRKRLALPAAPWSGKLPVYETENLSSPCLFGLFQPAIYLNEAAMDAEHPEHILAHEYAHYRHGDHVWAVLRCVCLAVHWYNPLVWWAAALSRRDCELACDTAVLRRLGEEDRIDYGHTLLEMVSRRRNPAALLQTATTMSAGKRAMKERIALIVRQPRMRKITLALVALVICGAVAVTFGGRARAEETEPDMPSAVTISQVFSSLSGDTSYITDPEEVARLWELYQGFAYEGTYDPTGMGGWFVLVSFHFGDEPDDDTDVSFILAEYGIRSQDGEYLLLKNIDEIYAEFLRMSRSAPITPSDPAPAEDVMMENARSIVEQVQSGADPSQWLPLMNYMDWRILAQAAVDAGMDEGDGSGAAANVIGDITRYVEAHGASMTTGEYLHILSASNGLDGAPAEGYGYMIYQMYERNPSQFAYVVLEMLPEEQQNNVLDLFRGEWMFHREPYGDSAPTREDAIAQLEANLTAYIIASPSEMTLRGAGSTFQIQLLNASGIYALTYASSDTRVAEVDNNGVVTAVGPGEAVISLHYEGAGGPLDFECRVQCEWEDTDLSEFNLEGDVRVKEDGSEVIFSAYKQGWKFFPPDWERGYTATYSSSNLAVATVNPEGLVWSEGPGEAVITMHYLDSRGPKEYTALIHCDWDDTESVGIDDAYYRERKDAFQLYGEEIAAWEKRYEDYVANTPAAPTVSISYEDPSEIERAAADYLYDYYYDYFNTFFAQDPFIVGVDGEVLMPYWQASDIDHGQVTVDYALRIVPVVALPNGYHLSNTIQVKYGLTTTLNVDRGPSAGPTLDDYSNAATLSPSVITGRENWNLEYIDQDIRTRVMEQMAPVLASGGMAASVSDVTEDYYFPENLEPGDTLEIPYYVLMSRATGDTFGKYAFQCSAFYTFMA